MTTYHSRELIPLEKICAHCAYFTWRYREVGGWAYCLFNDTWFPAQKHEDITPSGSRTCEEWEHMGLKDATN